MESARLIAAFKKWAKGRRQVRLSIPLDPVPAARPRLSRWGTYYPKKYATWKKQALLYLPEADPVFPDELLVCLAEHHVKRPKTTKLSSPRGDTDNYLKASMDAVTKCGGVWSDDDQVAIVLATKQFTLEAPRTDIIVVEL